MDICTTNFPLYAMYRFWTQYIGGVFFYFTSYSTIQLFALRASIQLISICTRVTLFCWEWAFRLVSLLSRVNPNTTTTMPPLSLHELLVCVRKPCICVNVLVYQLLYDTDTFTTVTHTHTCKLAAAFKLAHIERKITTTDSSGMPEKRSNV